MLLDGEWKEHSKRHSKRHQSPATGFNFSSQFDITCENTDGPGPMAPTSRLHDLFDYLLICTVIGSTNIPMNSLTSVLRQQQSAALSKAFAQRFPTTIVRPTAAIRHYTTVRKEHTITSRTINFILGTGIIVGGLVGISYAFDSRASIHKYVTLPLLHWTMNPETAHLFAIKALKMGLSPWDTQEDDPSLQVKVQPPNSL